ncbi:DNA topoisomerase III [Marinobacter zhanjiangensis]|uniref:DNA topoisomerase n=1 Tax=Marinobacter zhanjiangensis TaxID=578215 RepID=A0ABQ3AXJ5_9GAMM|nr:DNA topoisomerase 3 [Marinobacter zhanjiangensis]GGY70984.1 DNA topoisomerase 3 [Marinobacter zhanjiangensis]
MQLYIAEKPSLGRAIADALPGPVQKGPGWLRCGEGEQSVTVSWCIGHLLEPAEPASYDPRWKSWRMEDLPVFPERWRLMPRDSVAKQLDVLKGLIRQAAVIVHAGDPDREGQLLVDEVIRYFGAQCPVQRVLINDLNPDAVRRALSAPRDNNDFRRLSHSALARQRADWLYGINLTRYYTLSYRQQGADGVYSVGRVQTPVLGLVVHRDDTIANFEPKPWYRITITAQPAEGDSSQTFEARWLPSESVRDHLDEEDRLLNREIADDIASAVQGRPGRITAARFRDRREAPPLPLSLSALQIEAGKAFGMGAKDVLDTAQNLYEKHQLITYPRSDSRYLPEGHLGQSEGVTRAIGRVDGSLAEASEAVDLSRRTAAWNDAKVDAHHAIIPTLRARPSGPLSQAEQNIYNLVARYYLMQFMADAIHREGRLDLTITDHRFRATETALLDTGWKSLEPRQRKSTAAEGPAKKPLPRLEPGDDVTCTDTSVKERMTQPPQHFTDATLLAAMTNIARFVSDPELRRTLRETDGLGTEATRAAIMETLFRREYLYRAGRHIRAAEKGRTLIHALPEAISQPDMTARWEASLEQIRAGEGDPRQFLDQLKEQISGFIRQPAATAGAPSRRETADVADGSEAIHCPKCRAPMRVREGKYGQFHACTRFPDCNGTRPIEDTAPEDGTSQRPWPCPACYAPLVRRKSHRGWFWGCSNFPSCRQTVNDDNGAPAALQRPPAR